MANLFLYISKSQRDFTRLRVICTFGAGIEGARGRVRSFPTAHDLEKALQDAGVPDHELNGPQQVLNTGLPTFIPVNVATAQELGVLEYRERTVVEQTWWTCCL